jgi:hypothetical protein
MVSDELTKGKSTLLPTLEVRFTRSLELLVGTSRSAGELPSFSTSADEVPEKRLPAKPTSNPAAATISKRCVDFTSLEEQSEHHPIFNFRLTETAVPLSTQITTPFITLDGTGVKRPTIPTAFTVHPSLSNTAGGWLQAISL